MRKTIIIFLMSLFFINIANAAGATCSISSQSDLNFTCSGAALANCMSVGVLTLNCTSPAQYILSINQGNSRNFIQRKLMNVNNNGKSLNYNIYTTPNKMNILGDGTQGSVPIIGTCSSCSINIYGFISDKIPNTVWEGLYTDGLIATLNYQ